MTSIRVIKQIAIELLSFVGYLLFVICYFPISLFAEIGKSGASFLKIAPTSGAEAMGGKYGKSCGCGSRM